MDHERLARFAEQHPIRRLALFGSVLRGDFRPTSDVDVLVEFEPGARVGLIRLAGLEQELGEIIGRKVDLRTPADLSRYFRQGVLNSADTIYEAHERAGDQSVGNPSKLATEISSSKSSQRMPSP